MGRKGVKRQAQWPGEARQREMKLEQWGKLLMYHSYLEEWRFGKDVGFNLMGCAPDVLLVLSICGESEYWNSVGRTWSKDQS
jgi:hypothetical protein